MSQFAVFGFLKDFFSAYFVQTGIGWAIAGGFIAVAFGGVGSARGIRVAAAQAAGVMSEKPELFGKLLVLMSLPGTQGFYGLICAIMIARKIGLTSGTITCQPIVGLSLFAVGLCTGFVLWRSAFYQGETSAACINLVAKKPEEAGRAILLPALVETYAVVALLAAILFITWMTPEKGLVIQKDFVSPLLNIAK